MIKILIAEDFEIIREDLKENLEKEADIEVLAVAGSGEEIVDLALKYEADLILMDIEMETTNAGIIATELIRDEKPEQKIIFLTVHETDDIILKAMGTGAIDYIIKGSDISLILEHIRNAYAGKPMMEYKIQSVVMKEYKRLQSSERSLLYFINNVSKLTGTERELVKLLLEGKKPKEIAQIRAVTIITIKTQINSLLKKFACRRTKEIISLIRELNLYHLFEK